MRLNIGGTTREAASTSTYSFRLRQVNFSYTVVAADVDPDGISIPAGAIVGANRWVTRNNRTINLNNAALPSQSAHKVFGGSGAYVSATNPASLTESALNGATVTVTLTGLTYASGVSASSFALATNPTIAGLTISNVTGGTSGTRTATLTLATGTGYGFSRPSTLAVRVRAAAHSGSTDITSGTLSVSPTPGAALALALASATATDGGASATLTLASSGVVGANATLAAGLAFGATSTGRLPRRSNSR